MHQNSEKAYIIIGNVTGFLDFTADECILDNCDIRWELIPKPKPEPQPDGELDLEPWQGWMPLFVCFLGENKKMITRGVELEHSILDLIFMISCKEKGINPYRQNPFMAGMSLGGRPYPGPLQHQQGVYPRFCARQNGRRDGDICTDQRWKHDSSASHRVPLHWRSERVGSTRGWHSPGAAGGWLYAGYELGRPEKLLHPRQGHLTLVDDAFKRRKVRMMIHLQIVAAQKTIHLDVESIDTIRAVKDKIQAQEGIPAGQQVLFFPHKRLHKNAFTLEDYFIPNDSTLCLAQIIGHDIHVNGWLAPEY